MAVAKKLSDIHPDFMQPCHLCSRLNRIVVKAVYQDGDRLETYPDIGYSFCNCHDIFYTDPRYLNEPYNLIPEGQSITITQPDLFFCEWGNNPYTWKYWNPRKYPILWDMHSLVEYLEETGYAILSYHRNFDIQSSLLGHFIIKAEKIK